MNETLRKKLIDIATGACITAGVASGGYYAVNKEDNSKVPVEVALAQEIGYHFESSGRHIGKPYVDYVGKGRPWTVCAGLTGSWIDPQKYYSVEDCKALELPRYMKARDEAKKALKHWESYNPYVKASFIDMAFNVPSAFAPGRTIMMLANSGDLDAACLEMTKWVYGTVNGQSVKLNGLVLRRDTTEELCSEWGRAGHFSPSLLKEAGKP